MRTSAAARAEIAGRFRYILVDEFQDTNRAQAELVAALAEAHRNVTVVGDDDQAIYAFRGAAIDNILGFRDRYRGCADRRPAAELPVARADPGRRLPAHPVQRSGAPRGPRPASASGCAPQRVSPDAAPVRLEAFATGSEEADWIAAEIGRRIEAGAAPRDHAVLVRANGQADPILRALNMAGIPWRFSGASGLYARPEVRLLLAFLRVVADLESSVDLYALAASDVYGLGGEDLTAIVNMARRRNRSVWAVLEELDAQPGILRVAPATRAAVASTRRRTCAATPRPPTSDRPARCSTGSCARAGCSAGWSATESTAAEEALQNIARFFEIVRAQSALLADDRAVFVARSPRDAHRGGRRPGDGGARSRRRRGRGPDRPQGEGPRVPGRLPAGHGRRSLPVERPRRPAGAAGRPGPGSAADAETSLAEERRLCYVAMTRARDELILSHAADYGGARARRVSPFVLEALDLPAAAGVPGAGARAIDAGGAARRVRRDGAAPPTPDGPITEPLSLSFYQIDDYLTCPLKYKYAHVLRVPLAPHHAIVYGAALHKAVQLFHQRHAKGHVMSETELDEVFESAWSNEGFVSRDHEEARLAAGRAALRRFRAAQLQPDAVIPTYVEREFSFTLGGDRVRGRWDRVDVVPAGEGSGDRAAPSSRCAGAPTRGRRRRRPSGSWGRSG